MNDPLRRLSKPRNRHIDAFTDTLMILAIIGIVVGGTYLLTDPQSGIYTEQLEFERMKR